MIPRILILGRGYVANYISKHLAGAYKVCIVSKTELDYTNRHIFEKELKWRSPDIVINCSGYTGTPNIDSAEYEKELCWKLNVTIPINVHNICVENNIDYIHISTGCIYTNYDKIYDENDTPNFGLFDVDSSFYSKSKHAYELQAAQLPGTSIRIRMPFASDTHARNYLTKIKSYDSLITNINSKTYIPDLARAVSFLIDKVRWIRPRKNEVFNVVNSQPLSTIEVCELMEKYRYANPNWQFVDIDKIPIKAGRSNCVLSTQKIESIGFKIRTERECLEETLQGICEV